MARTRSYFQLAVKLYYPPSFKAPSESQYKKRDSNGSRSTNDTLAVTRILEASDIPCYLVGVPALIIYGAARVRPDWEIYVLTELIAKATQLLQSGPHSSYFSLVGSWPYPSTSLIHTYHHFKAKDTNFYFILVPSQNIHIAYKPSNITHSLRVTLS
ncbi:hypothetical protein BKA60DRAFT_570918 [Fusarium oxysporum]|nr:hypothetical protein BKA60DRAFT_570918 [Fusarium oxysporum]